MVKLSDTLDKKGRLWLVAVGFLLIIAGNAFKCEVVKVNLDQLVANVGALIAVIGLLQAVFDSAVREQIVSDVYASVTKGSRIRDSGIADAVPNSREVDYSTLLERSQRLIVGTHYSSRFFEDCADRLARRLKAPGETIVLFLDPDSAAAEYLKKSGSGRSDIAKELRRAKDLLILGNSKHVLRVHNHKRVLRYTFVMGDNDIWIRFFTNSEGFSHVPAVHVTRGGALFDFFESDIMRLLEHASQ